MGRVIEAYFSGVICGVLGSLALAINSIQKKDRQ